MTFNIVDSTVSSWAAKTTSTYGARDFSFSEITETPVTFTTSFATISSN